MVYRQSNTFRLRQERYNLHMYNFRLILAIMALGTIGILVIHSAADGYAEKQLYGFAGGLILMLSTEQQDGLVSADSGSSLLSSSKFS